MKTVSKQRLTAQPQFRDSLSHFILVPHKALVHAAILSCDRHHGNTFPGNRPYASARSQWLAVLQPVQRRLRKSTCAARLKSSLEKKGLDENGPRVLTRFLSLFLFPSKTRLREKTRAASRPPPQNRIIPERGPRRIARMRPNNLPVGEPRDSGPRLRFLHLLPLSSVRSVTELTNRRGRETLQGDERSRRYVFRGEKWKLSITK